MALQITVSRTPEQLAADAAALSTVDWPRVWSGFGTGDPAGWCESFGWELITIGRSDDCTVRLPSGGTLSLAAPRRSGNGPAIREGVVPGWRVEAETGADNPGILDSAETEWMPYLDAVRTVLGDPSGRTPPGLAEGQPFRSASWRLEGALAELSAFPSDDVGSGRIPGDLGLDLVIRADTPDAS
ncbi:MAG TPA: hypothetical protein VN408_40375 [Actinoplanes sp.]|nr:hypothetical protein [Actinoplanes sp.]